MCMHKNINIFKKEFNGLKHLFYYIPGFCGLGIGQGLARWFHYMWCGAACVLLVFSGWPLMDGGAGDFPRKKSTWQGGWRPGFSDCWPERSL